MIGLLRKIIPIIAATEEWREETVADEGLL
jgi:hypothetical protein